MTKKERKAQEVKVISGIPSDFWQSSGAAVHGILLMKSQPGAALGVIPIPGFSAIMNYSSTTTSGKCKSDGTAGLGSQPFSTFIATATEHPASSTWLYSAALVEYLPVSFNSGKRKVSFPSLATFHNMANEQKRIVVLTSSPDPAPSQTSTITPAPHSQHPPNFTFTTSPALLSISWLCPLHKS